MFLEACADALHQDRPSLWPTRESALKSVTQWANIILDSEGDLEQFGAGGFELAYDADDDFTEWTLVRSIVSYAEQGDEWLITDWTDVGEVINKFDLTTEEVLPDNVIQLFKDVN